MTILIRRAKTEDLKSIQLLNDDFNNFRNKKFNKQNKLFHKKTEPQPKFKITDLKKNIFIVAEDNKTIIAYAFASLHKRKTHKLSKLGFIDEIFVNKLYQAKGIGKKLFNTLEKELVKLGCDHIIAHTDQENITAQKFYSNQKMNIASIEYWKKI